VNNTYYLTLSIDNMGDGFNLTMWMSTVEFFQSEKLSYPNYYFYNDGHCKWHMHANSELTIKMRAMVIEHASKICERNRKIASQRRAVNG